MPEHTTAILYTDALFERRQGSPSPSYDHACLYLMQEGCMLGTTTQLVTYF